MVEEACIEGARWVGVNALSERGFHQWFGVYPRTAVFVSYVCNTSLSDLIRVLWWMHEYPTRKEIRAMGGERIKVYDLVVARGHKDEWVVE